MPTTPRKTAASKTTNRSKAQTAPATDNVAPDLTQPLPDPDDLALIAGDTRPPPIWVGGVECVAAAPISTRQLLAMVNLVVQAYGGNFTLLRIDAQDPADFVAQFSGLLLPAVLAQPSQAFELIAQLVTPVDLSQSHAVRVQLTADPDPLELLDALQAVVLANVAHLQEVVGKLRAVLTRTAQVLTAARRAKGTTRTR